MVQFGGICNAPLGTVLKGNSLSVQYVFSREVNGGNPAALHPHKPKPPGCGVQSTPRVVKQAGEAVGVTVSGSLKFAQFSCSHFVLDFRICRNGIAESAPET